MNHKKPIFKLKNSRGFTLIELMITVAIVGILAAVALPAYQDYVARSQVSEGLVLASGAKPVIAEYYANRGRYPANEDIGFQGAVGSYIGSTTIGDNGAIVATFSNDAHRQLRGQTVTLTPEEDTNTGNLKWNCSSSVSSKFLPTSCENDGSGNPSNPGGGDNGETGNTPPFNPAFSASYDYGSYTYNNGVLYINGNLKEILSQDENGIVYAPSGYTTALSIDRSGNLVRESRLNGEGLQGTKKSTMFANKSSLENYSLTAGGVDYNILYPTYETIHYPTYQDNRPSYIKNNETAYKNYMEAMASMMYNSTVSVNTAPTQSEINNYNNAQTNFVNFLNEQKSNGVSLSSADEAFLKELSK